VTTTIVHYWDVKKNYPYRTPEKFSLKKIIRKKTPEKFSLFEQDFAVRMHLKFWPSHSYARLSPLFLIQVLCFGRGGCGEGCFSKAPTVKQQSVTWFSCSDFCKSGQTHSKPPTVKERSSILERGGGGSGGWGRRVLLCKTWNATVLTFCHFAVATS